MKGKNCTICLILIMIVSFSGCGGGGAVYDTVTLRAEPSANTLDSDVRTHSEPAGPTYCGATDSLGVASDSVDVVITSQVIPNLPSSITTSAVHVSKVTVKFSPSNALSPAIPDISQTLSVFVDPGTAVTVPIRIADTDLKQSAILSELSDCGTGPNAGATYEYFVTLKFEGTEVNSEDPENFEATLNVRFADFTD